MGSQVNHNADYIFTVDGLTIWEKLRNIRNFLIDRRLAYAVNILQAEKLDQEISNNLIDEYKLKEMKIFEDQNKDLLKKCLDEIDFLEKFEEKLMIEAEKTRIPGKTDDEMYEINFFEEIMQRNLLAIQSEIMSIGHITPETMKIVLRNPKTFDRAIEIGLFSEEMKSIAMINKIPVLTIIGENNETLALN